MKTRLLLSMSLGFFFFFTGNASAQNLELSFDKESLTYQMDEPINLQVNLNNYSQGSQTYLHSWTDESRYRKLKLGNNPDNIYKPTVDVVTGGNDYIEIVLRVRDDRTNWSKMQIRPNGIFNQVKLSRYVPKEVPVMEWITITIPIADFDGKVNFTEIKNLEFPYSASSKHYDWDIYSITFGGGASPFYYLGPELPQNAHNGDGGTSGVYAEWITEEGNNAIPEIHILVNNQRVQTTEGRSATYTTQFAQAGVFNFTIQAYADNELLTTTQENITVLEDISDRYSIDISNPTNNQEFQFNETIPVMTSLSGELNTDPQNPTFDLIRADLLIDGAVALNDTELPFEWSLENLPAGVHELQVVLHLDDHQISSNTLSITVAEPSFSAPEITLNTFYTGSQISAGYGFNVNGTIGHVSEGVEVETQLIVNETVVASSINKNFTLPAIFELSGINTWYVKAISNGLESSTETHQIEVLELNVVDNFRILSPLDQSIYEQGSTIPVQYEFSQTDNGEKPYWEITGPESGYTKLKIGNNQDNIYSPKLDLLSPGYTTMEITLKMLDGNPDLSRIVVCPQEVLTNAPKLSDYLPNAVDMGDGWLKISIPLSDFDASLDLSAMAYIAFPYSRSAGAFTMGLRAIEFTNHTNTYVFLGEEKMDNIHNGSDDPTKFHAELISTSTPVIPTEINWFMSGIFAGSNDINSLAAELAGNHIIEAIAVMPDGSLQNASPVTISVQEPLQQGDVISLRLKYNTSQNANMETARLRYNKDFAYSFTLDDGYQDAYSNAFRFLHGGIAEANGQLYGGLFYTDGCGNDVPFTGGVAWFSVNRSYDDIHINTPNYITWTQMAEMYNAGWDLLNHSYSHDASADADFYFQVDENQKAVFNQLGITMSHFVIPGGTVYKPYIPVAQEYGMRAIYAFKSSFEGYSSGLRVDDQRSWDNMTIYRDYKHDGIATPDNVSDKIDAIANESAENNHVWYNDFTHKIQTGDKSGSLQFTTFEHYMNHIASSYGKDGLDNVWMAPLQQVWEYLYVRDHVQVTSRWEGNDLLVNINISQIPEDLRTKAISILTNTTDNFVLVSETPGIELSSNPETGLINLQWDKEQPKLKTQQLSELASSDASLSIRSYPNPGKDYFSIRISGMDNETSPLRIYNMIGTEVYTQNISGDGTVHIDVNAQKWDHGLYLIHFKGHVIKQLIQ